MTLEKYNIAIEELAIELTGKTEVSTNGNWDLTPYNWSCPCCKRSKLHILRVSSSSQLIGKLVNHHDHIVGYLKVKAKSIAKEKLQRPLTEKESWFVTEKISKFLSRFERTLVCEDCNNSDPNAKNFIDEICSYFSFSPEDIKSFIRPSANKSHGLNTARIEEAFTKFSKIHDYRKSLGDVLIMRLLEGDRLWGDHSQYPEIKHYKLANKIRTQPVYDETIVSLHCLDNIQLNLFSNALNRLETKKHQKASKTDSEKWKRKDEKKARREATRRKIAEGNHFNHGEPWEVESSLQLKSDYCNGEGIEKLSQKYGRTIGGIKSKLKSLGIDF